MAGIKLLLLRGFFWLAINARCCEDKAGNEIHLYVVPATKLLPAEPSRLIQRASMVLFDPFSSKHRKRVDIVRYGFSNRCFDRTRNRSMNRLRFQAIANALSTIMG